MGRSTPHASNLIRPFQSNQAMEPNGMKRKSIQELGSLQKSIMETVWELGEATVGQVLERQTRAKSLAYTTILSAMQKLEKAGWLTHREAGRIYVYQPARSRAEEGQRSVRKLIDGVFNSDPLLMFQHLLDDQKLTANELTALKKMIDNHRQEMRHG